MRTKKLYSLLAVVALAAMLLAGMNQAAASNSAASVSQTGSKDTRQIIPFNSPLGHHAVLANPITAGKPINLTTGPEQRPNVPPVFGPDIQIDPPPDNPTRPHNETFMAANPTNPLNFTSGANDYGGASTTGYYYTMDGGTTWLGTNFAGPYPGGTGILPGGDPAGDFDGAGNAYFADLGYTSAYCVGGVYAHTSTNGGLTYSPPVQVAASSNTAPYVFLDKEWLAADKRTSGPHAGRVYVSWTKFVFSDACLGSGYVSSAIYLAYSDNQGATWSTPAQIVEAAHDQDQGSNIAVASDGTVYVAFDNCQGNVCTDENRIVKSTDGGVTWSTSVLLDLNSQIGFVATDGNLKYKADNTHAFRSNQFPIIAVSPTNVNTVYAMWNDHLNDGTYIYQGNTVYGGDIAFSRSTDGGNTWSTPIRVNDDPQGGVVHDQFFPWMTVGSDGTIHASWFDRRDDANNILYREYYAQSTNGGTSFTTNQAVADVGSNPAGVIFGNGDGFIGDYSGIAINQNNSVVLPVWTDERTASRQHIYTDRGVIGGPTPTPGVATNTPGITNTPAATTTPAPPSPTPCGSPAVWLPGMNIPATRVRAIGVYYPPNGKFYLLGGRTSDASGSDVLNPTEYDPTTNTWMTKTATFPTNMVNNMAGGLLTISGTQQIIAVGGSAAGGATSTGDVRLYNPTSDSLTTLSSDPWPAGAMSSTLPGGYAVVNNKLYILGGFVINVSMSSEIWEFDPARAAGSRWALKNGTLPVPLGYIPTAAIGNTIYTGGGSTYTAGLADSTNSYSYSPAADVVMTLTNQIPRATAETRAVSYNGKMWVLGGGRTPPNPSNEVDIYDPTSGTWSVGTPFINARRNDAADTDGTHIYLAGGYAPTAPSASLEIYTPAVSCATPTPTRTATPVATNTRVVTATPTDCPNPFVDITGNTFYFAIHYLYCRGVVNGLDPTHYGPAGTATRGQFAKVVVLGFGETLFTPTGGTQDFTDVPPSYFAYVYIETGFHYGILSGFDHAGCTAHGATFPCYLPNIPITRGQLTKLVVNAGGYTLITPTGGGQDFTDVPPSNVFYVSIETAYHNSIINGYPDHTFRPNNNIRRDEMAQIVYEGIIHRP